MSKKTKTILFSHNERSDIQKKPFEFDETLTIKEMLLDFLKKTNSKMILDMNKISFMLGAKILNQNIYLNKALKEVFRDNNKPIKIIDAEGIVGGKICLKNN